MFARRFRSPPTAYGPREQNLTIAAAAVSRLDVRKLLIGIAC